MHNLEVERLLAVDRFLKLKISKENELVEIAQYAAQLSGTDIALITLLDAEDNYQLHTSGIDAGFLQNNIQCCEYLTSHDQTTVINNTSAADDFRLNLGDQNFITAKFYAAVPLVTQDGLKLGSLCVMGSQPAELTHLQVLMLETLARQIIHILEFDYSLRIMKEQFLEAKKNEVTLRSVFESSKSCHLLVDLDLKILFYNKVLSDVSKFMFNKTIRAGLTITDLIDDTMLDDFLKSFYLAKSGKRVLKESLLDHKLGPIWWQLSYDPAFDEDSNVIGVYCTATDITEVKLSAIALAERDKKLHSIALIQSHELRKPVASILGLINLFKNNNNQVNADEFQMLERAATELDETIHEIVNYVTKSPETIPDI